MQPRHLFLVIFIMIIYGSAYPIGKIGTNSIPPILFSALRVAILFIGILPFIKFKMPPKNLILTLIVFSLVMGIGVYVCLYYALDFSSLVSPIIIGTQLSVPFGNCLLNSNASQVSSLEKLALTNSRLVIHGTHGCYWVH